MKVTVLYIGKARDANLNAFAAEFMKRASRYGKCEMREIVEGREDWWDKASAAYKVLLDPGGKRYDSAQFTALVERMEMEGRDLVFVIGGADGLPGSWKPRADLLLSLSPMTFPHELARAMLAEQVYRAFTTLRGHPYPR
ncbi:MAG: 23S rRNA (pseudouridine(1915)-N(3))-methyltransferase RlmH [Bryobacterales bacterium]|nr:23S rRNA (pseudouridine(1915)-N(3))-methyltransferase RlmH [Bryobacterales bacterium]